MFPFSVYLLVGPATFNGLARHRTTRHVNEATPHIASIVREASDLGDGRPPAHSQPAIETATIAHKKHEKMTRIKFISTSLQ
jgi:hypothetical protein